MLARCQSRELRLLEIGIDIDSIERHQASEPLTRLHVVADLYRAITNDAIEGGTDDGEREVALSLGKRRLILLKRIDCLNLLRLQHGDISLSSLHAGLPAVYRGDGLIAILLRLLECLLAGVSAGGEFLLAREFELSARLTRDGRIVLRLWLAGGGFLAGGPLAGAGHGGPPA